VHVLSRTSESMGERRGEQRQEVQNSQIGTDAAFLSLLHISQAREKITQTEQADSRLVRPVEPNHSPYTKLTFLHRFSGSSTNFSAAAVSDRDTACNEYGHCRVSKRLSGHCA